MDEQPTTIDWFLHKTKDLKSNPSYNTFMELSLITIEMEKQKKDNLPIHIHEGIENTWVYVDEGIIHVRPLTDETKVIKNFSNLIKKFLIRFFKDKKFIVGINVDKHIDCYKIVLLLRFNKIPEGFTETETLRTSTVKKLINTVFNIEQYNIVCSFKYSFDDEV